MSGTGPAAGGRPEPTAKARRTPGWAALGRRGEQPPAEGAVELHPVAVRPAESVGQAHHLGERLSAFVDGELGHDSRGRVQAHLATCRECLTQVDQLRAVKQSLRRSGGPGPSAGLTARLLAVAGAQADQDDDQDGPRGTGTLGGSRLTGGSFGRGVPFLGQGGGSFGSGALGADAPVPGIDPRAADFRRSPFAAPRPSGARPQAPGPSAAEPAVRSPQPRGRRLVFAAASAFSVAAVTLSGVGGLAAAPAVNRGGTAVTPANGSDGGAIVPVDAQLPIAPHRPAAGRTTSPPSAGLFRADHRLG